MPRPIRLPELVERAPVRRARKVPVPVGLPLQGALKRPVVLQRPSVIVRKAPAGFAVPGAVKRPGPMVRKVPVGSALAPKRSMERSIDTTREIETERFSPDRRSSLVDEGPTCKDRPSSSRPKGGGSRAFVPWCDLRR